jgi:hypothetical protein
VAEHSKYDRRFIMEAECVPELVFDPAILSVLAKGAGAKTGALSRLLEQEDESGYVFSFPLLLPEFCDRLVQEGAAFRDFTAGLADAGAAGGGAAAVLARMGLRWLDRALLDEV